MPQTLMPQPCVDQRAIEIIGQHRLAQQTCLQRRGATDARGHIGRGHGMDRLLAALRPSGLYRQHIGRTPRMRAAAENLVPVTLELDGKCPVVVNEGFDIATAAERTLTVKTFNAGQICLSPDYVMLPEGAVDGFVEAAKGFMARAFPKVQDNNDYTSIIAPRHFDRLLDLIADAQAKGATIVPLNPAGEPVHDVATRKIAPVLILNATEDMRVMQEEIFGPLLPVVAMNVDQAIARINAHDRPLAAYLFSDSEAVQAQFGASVTSGALVLNDIMSHASIESLPFGGVGASGIGAYHGVHGFRRFSHFRPTVRQSAEGLSGQRLRAPYADKQAALENLLGPRN